jgi:hypothetical protein
VLPKLKQKSISDTVIFKFPVSNCGMAGDEGLLLVIVFAPIAPSNVTKNVELTTVIEKTAKSFGHFLSNFVGSKCASFAEKPKVFFFLDPQTQAIFTDAIEVGQKLLMLGECNSLTLLILFQGFVLEQKHISTMVNNHSGFFVCYSSNKGIQFLSF